MSLFAYWVHEPHPFLIQFSDTIGIRYYGLAYVFGFVGAAWMLQRYTAASRSQLPAAKAWDLVIVLILGVMVGGRLGSFLFYHPGQLIDDPLSFFRVWEGGMASHGGFIGVTLALLWYARRHHLPFLHLSDLIVSVGPLGLMLGRIANFLNGELWGKISDVPWAVIFTTSAIPGMPIDRIPPRHPSQLYEAALEGAILLAYLQWRVWKTDVLQRNTGRLTAEFLIGYAAARIICEQFREPDAELILGLSRGAFYSVFMLVAGVALFAWSFRRRDAERPGSL